MIKFYCSLILALCFNLAFSTEKVSIDNTLTSKVIGRGISYLEDKTGNLQFNDIIHSSAFTDLGKDVANFQESKSTFWLKFTINNADNNKNNFIEVVQPLLDEVDLYVPDSNNHYQLTSAGL